MAAVGLHSIQVLSIQGSTSLLKEALQLNHWWDFLGLWCNLASTNFPELPALPLLFLAETSMLHGQKQSSFYFYGCSFFGGTWTNTDKLQALVAIHGPSKRASSPVSFTQLMDHAVWRVCHGSAPALLPCSEFLLMGCWCLLLTCWFFVDNLLMFWWCFVDNLLILCW